MTIVLAPHEKHILHMARELRTEVGCPAKGGACYCTGQCQSPLVKELDTLIRSLVEKGHVPNYVAEAHEQAKGGDYRSDRNGVYKHWTWDRDGKCWRTDFHAEIHPSEDGTFSVSFDGVWCTPAVRPSTFEEAEKAALG